MVTDSSTVMSPSEGPATMRRPLQLHSPFVSYWMTLRALLKDVKDDYVTIDGHKLDIPSVVAIARHSKKIAVDVEALQGLQAAVDRIQAKLAKGEIIYGINTGFGGSASSRPSHPSRVQQSLMRILHYGVLADEFATDPPTRPIDENRCVTSMPETWVRAAMAIRMNSLIKRASGLRPTVIQRLADALNHDLVPHVPLRGSISASGDLSPLSYIGGMLQGKPAVRVHAGKGAERRLIGADEALRRHDITPVELEPKEGLAIVNGTAISSAVGALAMFEAHSLIAFAQVLTAMSVEALRGSRESFDPFFAAMRPHPGQIEAANNIRRFLAGTRMAVTCAQREETQQDRYSVRTAAQWLGPVLEDFALADRQIHVELNSVTDNPLVTPDSRMVHGGNFQAKAVTVAMEKVRAGCESIGHMLFSQSTELMNPDTSNGLPPNLVVDDPQESWMWKGLDVMTAALASELGFLCSPAGSHVKSAEMGNQALNSLALISARYTLTALDVLTQLSAVHALAACQALDLRALHFRFITQMRPRFAALAHDHLAPVLLTTVNAADLESALWTAFAAQLKARVSDHFGTRHADALDALTARVLAACEPAIATLNHLAAWKAEVAREANTLWDQVRRDYVARPDAVPLLGAASARVYMFVRHKLRIPFVDEAYLVREEMNPHKEAGHGESLASLGAMVTRLYASMKTGDFYAVVAACHEDAAQMLEREGKRAERGSKL